MREGPEELLEKNIEVGNLFAYYGRLLTERQQTALRYHYQEDLSLSEIADSFGVSRQNIDDMMRRSVQKLCLYEKVLGLMAQDRKLVHSLQMIKKHLDSALEAPDIVQAGEKIRAADMIVTELVTAMSDIDTQE